jgi:transposase
VDEHLWHHTTKEGEGAQGVDRHSGFDQARWRQQARLLDRLPGRSGKAYAEWLSSRGATFAAGEDGDAGPIPRLRHAIRDELEDAAAVLDAFQVVRLGLKAMEQTHRGSTGTTRSPRPQT